MENVVKKWEKVEKILGLSANHGVIDSVNESVTDARQWQRLGEVNLLVAELKQMQRLINHITAAERPTAYNIF